MISTPNLSAAFSTTKSFLHKTQKHQTGSLLRLVLSSPKSNIDFANSKFHWIHQQRDQVEVPCGEADLRLQTLKLTCPVPRKDPSDPAQFLNWAVFIRH